MPPDWRTASETGPVGGPPRMDAVTPPPQALSPQGASLGRRFAAWAIDWVMCLFIVFGLFPYDIVLEPGAEPPLLLGVPQSSWALMGVFAALNIVLVSLTGSTVGHRPVSYTHLRAHETVLDLVCRLLLEKKKVTVNDTTMRYW